jgi:hypothetical protein
MSLTMLPSTTENSTMARRAVLLALALPLLLLVVGAGCWRGEDRSELSTPKPTVDLSSLTLEEVYSRLAQAITRPGYVFHVSMNYDVAESGSFRVEVWVDLPRELARYESVPSPALMESADVAEYVSIVAGDIEYFRNPDRSSKHRARACLGADSPALSAMLGCEFFPEDATTRIETGVQYEGRAAVALVTEGASERAEETASSYASRLYLDETSFLALARVTKGTSDGRTWEIAVPYDTDFLPIDSLPEDIFDPASLGYTEEDPARILDVADLGITIYWLGPEFPGEGGLPPLALARVFTPGPWPYEGPGDKAQLEYEAADDEFGPVLVTLREWSLDEWEAAADRPIGGLPWVGPCVETKEVDLAGGRAVIFMGYETGPQPPTPPAPVLTPPLPADVAPVRTPSPSPSATECPERPLDRFMAHAYLGSTVVLVNAPIGAGGPALHGPYNSLKGMQAVLEALEARE